MAFAWNGRETELGLELGAAGRLGVFADTNWQFGVRRPKCQPAATGGGGIISIANAQPNPELAASVARLIDAAASTLI